jgi:hypothetical protein
MLKTSYNKETKEVSLTANLTDYRWLSLALTRAAFGPTANQALNVILDAAQNSSNDEDFTNQVEAFFDKLRLPEYSQEQLDGLGILKALALALPRQVVVQMDNWYRGEASLSS